jgi:hypothetical protein
MDNTCIIYIHGNPWKGVPSRQRYLMEQVSREAPVFYIENTEERRWRVTWSHKAENLTVVSGLLPMWSRFERRGWLYAQRIWAQHHLAPIRKKYSTIILWNAENCLRPYRYVPHDCFVYDCIDPCFSTEHHDIAAFEAREREICRTATLVFASSENLAEHCRQHNANVVLLNNACEPTEYSEERLAEAPRPKWWPATDKPVAAYLGTLDARFDFAVAEQACRQNPHVHFILAGLVLSAYHEQVQRLLRMGNVTCPGQISVQEGRFLLSRCSIGLIPFTMGPMNDAINPVKLYAYTLLGKPVVGTAVRELLSRPDIVLTASTADTFAQRVQEALQIAEQHNLRERLRIFALENTWEQRASEAWRALRQEIVRLNASESINGNPFASAVTSRGKS